MVFQHYSVAVANCAREYPLAVEMGVERCQIAEKNRIVNEHLVMVNLTALTNIQMKFLGMKQRARRELAIALRCRWMNLWSCLMR